MICFTAKKLRFDAKSAKEKYILKICYELKNDFCFAVL